jgi:hypothetical protein
MVSVVLLIILIGVIGIFVSIILGSLGLLFLVKNKIKRFIAKTQKPLPHKDTSPNLIELEKDEYRICE